MSDLSVLVCYLALMIAATSSIEELWTRRAFGTALTMAFLAVADTMQVL